MSPFRYSLVFLLVVVSPLHAEQRFSVSNLKRDTQRLSSDAFGGRAPLSPGAIRTRNYIERSMRASGLRPAVHGSFVQPVPMVQTETKRSPVPLFRAEGPTGAVELHYGKDLTLNVSQPVGRVDLGALPLVFVGYGITAPELNWDDYEGMDVRGKAVLILINDPDWRQPAGKGPFGGAVMTYYGRWMYKYEEAARHGAAAAIIIHDDRSAGYPFQVLTSSLGGPRLALVDLAATTASTPVQSWITHDAAKQLLALAGEDLAKLEQDAARSGFRARPLNIRTTIRFDVAARRGVSANLIGLLPGRSARNEFVLYTAHWDHLGRCPADRTGDTICNGAIDNATGVAALLELARAFSRAPRPARSILFIATTGEEYGLLGSHYYAAHPLVSLAKTVAEIDIDPLSYMQGRTRDVSMIADQTELSDVVREVAAGQHRVVTPDPEPEQGSRYRSDTLSFSRAGVPVVYAQGGVDVVGKPAGWGREQLNLYLGEHYHQPSDEYDRRWNWSGALEDLALYYGIGLKLANSKSWPNWFKNDEFRPARDRLLARH